MDTSWKEFEVAVYDFLKAIDPNNNINHNVFLPDIHTGKPRQRDVYLETNLCGFLPIKVLISCKKYKRKLNQQDIDAFHGEFLSSGAHKGVIYSYSGFNKNAIEKCIKLGISCCKLYNNRPADMPEVLLFDYYCCVPKGMISVIGPIDKRWNLMLWKDIFSIKTSEQKQMLEILVDTYKQCENNSLENRKGLFPLTNSTIIQLTHEEYDPLKIKFSCIWKYYRNRLEASLVNGSYSFSDKTFMGHQTGPIIDLKNSPGDHWVLVDKIPEDTVSNTMVAILSGGDVIGGLLSIREDEIKTTFE